MSRIPILCVYVIDLSVSSEPMELAKRRSPLHGRDYSHVMMCVNGEINSQSIGPNFLLIVRHAAHSADETRYETSNSREDAL